jgi:hypothetical protein
LKQLDPAKIPEEVARPEEGSTGMKKSALILVSFSLLMAGCSKVSSRSGAGPGDVSAASAPDPNSPNPAAASPAAPAPAMTLPVGTGFRVRLLETIDTRRNRAGDQFTASLDEPLVDGDRVVVPKGTTFTGHVVQAKPSGRFKGRAVLALRLDAFTLNGQVYNISSTGSSHVSKGHVKHNLAWIGGGSGGGAAIGAAAAGGPGALIGAGAGAAAGTVGSIFTGKRQVSLPVETTLRFSLQSPVTLS